MSEFKFLIKDMCVVDKEELTEIAYQLKRIADNLTKKEKKDALKDMFGQ